ncbi:MAG: 7-cyano-7-deazaguanine synthase QueC [Candidatus Aminicenantes bacterium RBG_13_62_12]|nr:MAG: 7-cyano-7-deazaguanine synthase QueC [Candidatus Aminicenantes bacterium RBG_13_62_12]
MSSCVVLFSGGLDSTTALYWARKRYDRLELLTFDYGQKHRLEVEMAARTASRLGLRLDILAVDLAAVGASALTDPSVPVPELDALPPDAPLPTSTYVPFRNGIFLSLAAAWAEARGIGDIVCGFNILDSPDYPDTGPEFVQAMEHAVRLGTKAGRRGEPPRIIAPFTHMKKSGIIALGLELGADYSTSVSCYRGGEIPCGRCPACLLRAHAWEEAGRRDPLLLRLEKEGKI